MSQESFEQFRKIVLQESSLQNQLRGLKENDAFTAEIIKLGAERGYRITSEDVEEAKRSARRVWLERWI